MKSIKDLYQILRSCYRDYTGLSSPIEDFLIHYFDYNSPEGEEQFLTNEGSIVYNAVWSWLERHEVIENSLSFMCQLISENILDKEETK